MNEKLTQLWNSARKKTVIAGKEIWYFLSSTFFLKNFASMIAAILLFLAMLFWWLKCYTNHGESLQVADYTGLKIEDVIRKAEDRNLRIEVIDSTWIEGMGPGVVIEQNPLAFSRVKENRTIYLKITKLIPDDVLLPPLRSSYDYDQYVRGISVKGIKATIRERVFDNKLEPNTILHLYYGDTKVTEAMLNDGFKVPKGSVLEFVITERGLTTMEVPNVICQTYPAAEFLITSMQLGLGVVLEDADVTNRTTAYIYRQDPPADGRRVPVGESITLYLTQELPAGCN
ncbi:MAG: PASTA domain-containing protein [Saprospiraceae bacterium]|nr:PASTA domain-containing protein [Saprospiraceae bacterium]